MIERHDCRLDDPALIGPVWSPPPPAAERTTYDAYRDARRAFEELERIDAAHQRARQQLIDRGCME